MEPFQEHHIVYYHRREMKLQDRMALFRDAVYLVYILLPLAQIGLHFLTSLL
jgi:hypothetical protein